MAASLVGDGCPNKRCSISLKAVTSTSENVVKMSDGQCYYTSYISRYIKLLLRNYQIDHPMFVLPTRSPILQSDLNKLYITPAEIQSIKDEWHASDEYQAIEADRIARDAEMAAEMGDESGYESAESYGDESDAESVASLADSVASQVHNEYEINTVIRWGIRLSHIEEEVIPPAIIHRIDRFLMPAGHIPQQPLEEDEIIQHRRKRPLGRNEYDFLYRGEMPPNTQLGIRIESTGEVYNDLETYVDYINSISDEDHQIEVASVTGTPITGGRKKLKTRKRKTKHGGRSRKSRRRKNKMI